MRSSAAIRPQSPFRIQFDLLDYDLATTLASGQTFRWKFHNGGWESAIKDRWVRLTTTPGSIHAETTEAMTDWSGLGNYLQVDTNLDKIIASFPNEAPMKTAVTTCRGLRLLRQDPWECLASFILSSSKQIVQIQQIVNLLCERFGEPLPVPPGHLPVFSFPTPERISKCSESELRACKMGFRAPYLEMTAKSIATGKIEIEHLGEMSVDGAREQLLTLPGVGRKIADCVLLFAFGFQQAFPIDVWIMKALRDLYFPKKRVSLSRLHEFCQSHFGPFGGYAQQYLFHYMRHSAGRTEISNHLSKLESNSNSKILRA